MGAKVSNNYRLYWRATITDHPLRGRGHWGGGEDLQQPALGHLHDWHLRSHEPRHQVNTWSICIKYLSFQAWTGPQVIGLYYGLSNRKVRIRLANKRGAKKSFIKVLECWHLQPLPWCSRQCSLQQWLSWRFWNSPHDQGWTRSWSKPHQQKCLRILVLLKMPPQEPRQPHHLDPWHTKYFQIKAGFILHNSISIFRCTEWCAMRDMLRKTSVLLSSSSERRMIDTSSKELIWLRTI